MIRRNLRRETVDGFARCSPLGGVPYQDFLKTLHVQHQVQRYLEIGTQHGKSLEHARHQAVAIDPEFLLDKQIWAEKPGIHLYETTSDDFFAHHNPCEILGGEIALAFIDGMHLADFVLRDFLNVERYCGNNAMIVLHDALPQNFEMTERNRRAGLRRDKPLANAWTGDVWRVVPLLQRERPDLRIKILDCPPTGLVLIDHLDPSQKMPAGRRDELVHALTDSEPDEAEFWDFIESVSVMDSREML
jgi:hypothetical protein